MAGLEFAGIASVLPFMHIAADPNSINESYWLNLAYTFLGFESHRAMLIFTGVSMLLLLMLANGFSAYTTWYQHKISWDTAHNISTRLLKSYLDRPYTFFLKNNTAELQSKIVLEVGQICSGVLIPLTDLVARILVIIVIFCLLLLVNTKLALIIVSVLGTAYGLVYLFRKSYLERLGNERMNANLNRFKSLVEALTGIKASRVYDAKDFFFKRFETASENHSRIQPQVQLVSIVPKYLIELLAFGGIIGVTIYLVATSGDLTSSLPILSLYAIAGYRLLPSLQRAFLAMTKLKHTFPVVDSLYEDLNYSASAETVNDERNQILHFENKIKFDQIKFSYEEADQVILTDIDLEIRKGEIVAFVGTTGSGKTTLIDLIVGLLQPDSGEVLIDDQPLNKTNTKSWQKQIGYVQQDVFLFDDTVKSNIAIGVEEDQIEEEGVIRASKIANIHSFIQKEMKDGYDTEIGERGVRLSGGQQQRLGIARALYRNPSVLILDEATSALDGVTESKVIDSLKKYQDDLTMIIIAHRLSTVRHADCIYILEKGKIIGKGTYDLLINTNTIFREMVEFS